MALTPGWQKALFAAVVVALAGLGVYLLLPRTTGRPSARSAAVAGRTTRGHAAGPSGEVNPPTATRSGSSAPAGAGSTPTATPTSGATGGVDIYRWLPFTQRDLAAAAGVTTSFTVDYDTYTYTESPAGYAAAMSRLATAELVTTLRNAYATPGVAALRAKQHQDSSATAAIDSIRAFGPTSITFVVSADQTLTGTQGTHRTSTRYAVTVTGSGTSWRANDIQLASAGNS